MGPIIDHTIGLLCLDCSILHIPSHDYLVRISFYAPYRTCITSCSYEYQVVLLNYCIEHMLWVSCCTLQLLHRARATFHQHGYQTVHFNYFIEHVLLPINISIMSYTSATSSSQPTYVSDFIEHVLPLTNTSTRLHNSVASLENVLRTSYQVT